MSRQNAGFLTFGIIIFIMYTFGIHTFEAVWSFPSQRSVPLMVIALVGTGIYATIRLGFPQIKFLKHGINVTKGIYDDPNDEGDLNHFKALTTALSATVGIGNIAGVATAMYYGGPGALFWMWVTAFFGTTLKYAECTLSLKYREMDAIGKTAGGPMYTIENGLGPKWRWLAVTFACFAIICSFFTGNAIQSNTLTQQLYAQILSITGPDNALMATNSFTMLGSESNISIMHVIIGLSCAAIVGSVILGGIKRIGNVTSYLVPIMAAVYVMCALFIILTNFERVGESFSTIFTMAFNPPSIKDPAIGIAAGAFISFLNTMMMGVKRGLFSSESGQGSAAIAHSTAKTPYAVREGVVALLEPYIDTIIICTLTGLVIMVTNSWHLTEFYSQRIDPSILDTDLKAGVLLTSHAFGIGMPSIGAQVVTVAVVLFALSTAISWSFYGDRATEYLFGTGAIPIYRYCYVFMVFVGSMLTLEQVWIFGDAALAFMTFPNLLAIILLSNKLKDLSSEYFSKY